MSPQISVVMPVWNAEATIARAIESVRAQTARDWELLVVDDGSTDGTRGAAESAAGGDGRVRVLAREHRGMVAALNEGITAAKGKLIARMDADDEMYPERLDAQAAFLNDEENSDCGLVSCLVEFGGDRAASGGYALHVDWINALVTPEEIALNRFVESPLAHPSVMFRRECVEKLGGYRAGNFPEDYELWLRWMEAGVRMAKMPRVLLRWNDRAARASRTDERYAAEAFFRVKAEYVARELGRSRGGRPVWVWGAGRQTRKRLGELEKGGVRIAGFVDVDAKKWMPALGGKGAPVIGPEELPPADGVVVLIYVSVRGARDFIRGELRKKGFVEGRDFWACA
jgi:glycosyltransferase involved in cell wall biosynthesis